MKKLLILSVFMAFAIIGLQSDKASAWHYNLSGAGVCQEDGSYNISWKVDNTSEPTNLDVKSSSNTDVVAVGEIIEAGKTKTFGQTVDGTKPGTYKLELTADWKEDRKNMKKSATVELKEACSQPEVPETPETPETPQVLPSTGAGTTVAAFIGFAVIAAALHNLFSRRTKA